MPRLCNRVQATPRLDFYRGQTNQQTPEPPVGWHPLSTRKVWRGYASRHGRVGPGAAAQKTLGGPYQVRMAPSRSGARLNPRPDLRLEPADSLAAQGACRWERALGHLAVDTAPKKACDAFQLPESQNVVDLQPGVRHAEELTGPISRSRLSLPNL